MTDVIGWEEADAPPRRRLPRLPRWSWLVVPVVLLAAALAPVLRDHLAQQAARNVSAAWAERAALADARDTAVNDAQAHLGIADTPTYVALIRAVDEQEEQRLQALEHRLRGAHTWSGDVTRTTQAVRATLRGDVNDLSTEIRELPTMFADVVFPPQPTAPATAALAARAATAVESLRRHHDLGDGGSPHATLDAGRAILAALHRPTDRPTGLHLVVDGPDGYTFWDVDSGHQRDLTVVDGTFGIPVRVGGKLLVQAPPGLFDPATSQTQVLPPADTYLSAGQDAVWRVHAGTVQRYGGDGRPIGRAVRVPDGMTAGDGAGGLILLTPPFTGDDVTAGPVVIWNPLTGRERRLRNDCQSYVLGADAVLSFSCDQRHLDVLTMTSTTHVKLPAGTAISTVGGSALASPDGRLIAIPLRSSDRPDATPGRVGVYDLRTGRLIPIPGSALVTPAAWSPDGRTLLLRKAEDPTESSTAQPLALWRVGDDRMSSIRLPLGNFVEDVIVIG